MDLPDLRAALFSLPETLHETYNRILFGIPSKQKEKAVRILQFLAYSERPLRLREAVDAVAVSPGLNTRYQPDERMPDAREIATVCSSLVTVVQMDDIGNSSDDEQRLQLAHFSVKEYLISGQVVASFQDHLREFVAGSSIAKVSLVYLLSLNHTMPSKQIRTEFPLSVYSARYWM